MDFKSLIKAREALKPIWERADLKGRCWGISKEENPYRASNITIAIGRELISLSQKKNGKLKIHEFSKTENTSLGKEVKKILKKAGLSFEE